MKNSIIYFVFRILSFFNTTPENYSVIFTSGATNALKLVARNFKWQTDVESTTKNNFNENNTTPHNEISDKFYSESQAKSLNGVFVYMQENHTSVLGMREDANLNKSEVYVLKSSEIKQILQDGSSRPIASDSSSVTSRNCLFAYSVQCNYSGSKYPLEWIQYVQEGRLHDVLNKRSINNNLSNYYYL